MAYNIVYKKSVHRDLKKLSKPETKRIKVGIAGRFKAAVERAETYGV